MGMIVPKTGTAAADAVSRLLFGAIRREVLFLLLGRPDEKFYLREILRAAGGGSGAVQRELKQLTEAGLLHRERRGNQVFFSANSEAPIFPELQSILQKTAGVSDVLRSALARHGVAARIDLALVYGSVASGTQSAASDVDFLIVGALDLADVVPALRSAEGKLGRDVNVSLYNRREFRQKVRAGSPFVRRLLAGPKLFVVGDERGLKPGGKNLPARRPSKQIPMP